MDTNSVIFERKLGASGTSVGVSIPPELLKYIGVEKGKVIKMTGDQSKHGKYIAIWAD